MRANLADFANWAACTQETILNKVQTLDKQATFVHDPWTTPSGNGNMATLQKTSTTWEKAGVGFTSTSGVLTTQRAAAMSERGRKVKPGDHFKAVALSLVMHAASPHVPTLRADVRVFALESGACWVGGGADLTPTYVNEQDARDFHVFWRKVCQRHPGVADYSAFKAWCDRYFYLPSRNETRGVGGIFFDDLSGEGAVEFAQDVADSLMDVYLPIVERRRHSPYSDAEKQWQLLRRGRYLEFNLLYDRGVRFGLEAGGVDSVERLMVSAPPVVAFEYKRPILPGSPEEFTQQVLKCPRDWLV